MTLDYPDWTRLFHLVGTDITIPINIQASAVTLPVSIEASTVTFDVNIVAAAVTLPISIDAATVTLDVNIAAQVGNITFEFADQSVAVFDAAKWFAHTAAQWSFYDVSAVTSEGSAEFTRVVPAGHIGFLCGIGLGYRHKGASAPISWIQRVSGVNVAAGSFDTGGSVIFDIPFRATATQSITLRVDNYSAETRNVGACVWGYDEHV